MTIAIDMTEAIALVKGMKKLRATYYSYLLCSLIILLASSPSPAGQMREVSYLYKLSTFTGAAPVGAWPKLRLDSTTNEIYVISDDEIKVFNQKGMQIFQLGVMIEEQAGGQTIRDAAIKKNGDIIFLAQSYNAGKINFSIILGNYRGDPVSRLALKNLPPELSDFHPDRMFYRDGLLYLANLSGIQIVVVNEEGSYLRDYNIMSLLRKEKEKEGNKSKKALKKAQTEQTDWDMGDFSVNKEGNILFTVPVAGEVYRLTPDLQLSQIGRRGSGPGKFGIPSSIVADGMGNYLVSDILRCVVMIFDKDFNYLGAFGGRNAGMDTLIAPRGLAVDANNRLYVSQSENMGVSVFQLIYN